MAKKPKKKSKPKDTKAAVLAVLKGIEKKQGEGSVFTVDSKKADMKLPRWSSGLESLDNAIGGGVPKGRLIECYGPESSGKTSLAYWLCAQHELAAFFPVEGTFDAPRAKAFGNRKGQLYVCRNMYGEMVMQKLCELAEAGIPFIVVDSIPALLPKKLDNNFDFEESQTRAPVAQLLSKTLPVLHNVCERTGTTVLFINQTRDAMNAMMFGPKSTTPGGKAKNFYFSLRWAVARRAWIKVPNKNPNTVDKEEHVGIITKLHVVKSKVSNPGSQIEIPMFFGHYDADGKTIVESGYCSHDDIKPSRQLIMKDNNEKYKR